MAALELFESFLKLGTRGILAACDPPLS